MLNLLWLVPALPFAGFLILAFCGSQMPRTVVSVIGCGSVGLAALLSLGIAFVFLSGNGEPFRQELWTWFDVGGLTLPVGLHLDALSLLMMLVVTGVAFLIHVYSTGFMAEDDGFSRFFAYLNLFVGAMLILVLADSLPVLLLGWEGVGLCSYLLIGFWYTDPVNGLAARKAFVVTRIGDTALLIGLFLLFQELGTLEIVEVLRRAGERWQSGDPVAVTAAALILGGAVGKSAQLPLQTWLPDAMAGPTPVSALVHAATMVTAGVYLIARMHVIFLLAPAVMTAVAVIGSATMLMAGCSALVQHDLKRVLAYSTISQLGYMFLALGVGAWSAAMFHFMTHAFFKALLFLAAGAVIHALHHEHDMFKMGGLRKRLPAVFWTFVIGAASLAALPLVTSGFYSKELILWSAWSSGHPLLWAAGIVGAFMTALYTGRMVFVTFFGEAKSEVGHAPGKLMVVPLCVLAFLATVAGFLETPHTFGHVQVFSRMLGKVLPALPDAGHSLGLELTLQFFAVAVVLCGVVLSWWLYVKAPHLSEAIAIRAAPVRNWWLAGWGFDALYDFLIVRPLVALAEWNRKDFIDSIYHGIAWGANFGHLLLSHTQNGRLRWYATGISIGTVALLLIVLFL
ncbi:MAG: NADH-quinone oxidoreductase subunit L [Verrucomicrobiota bacterium]